MPTTIYAITAVAFAMGFYLLGAGIAILLGVAHQPPHVASAPFGIGIGLVHLVLGYFVYPAAPGVRPFVAALPALNYLAEYGFATISSSLQDWELAAIVSTALLIAFLLFLPTKTRRWFTGNL
ncbi:hypothetical protein [Nevskia ramosa]|uniref:hypothetical protein n=1 Tax=Nevskia ramosa TaxID=64002 RepID=UPI003D11EDDE